VSCGRTACVFNKAYNSSLNPIYHSYIYIVNNPIELGEFGWYIIMAIFNRPDMLAAGVRQIVDLGLFSRAV
jgi:hypothetical protein